MEQLTSTQLAEWEAYDKIDPVGEWREDYRMAYLACTVTNIVKQLYAEKGDKPKLSMPIDLMPIWDREAFEAGVGSGIEVDPQQDLNNLKTALLSIAHTQNKKVQREEGIIRTKPPNFIKK